MSDRMMQIEIREHEVLHLVLAMAHRFSTRDTAENRRRLVRCVADAMAWFDGAGDRYTIARMRRLLSMN